MALAIILNATGCFSPWTGDKGYIQIGGAGGGIARTVLPTTGEQAVMRYELTLTGPGGTIAKTLGAGGGTVELAPGTWHIAVKAYANGRLRAMTEQDITVGAGKTEIVTLKTVIGVKNEVQLLDALTNGSNLTDPLHTDNIIVLENDITIDTGITTTGGGVYTVIAEPGTTRAIRRGTHLGDLIAISATEDLILGSVTPGWTGELVIDGGGSGISGVSGPLMKVSGGFTMYDGVTLQNNSKSVTSSNGGGVYVDNGGVFTMKGGAISGNSTTASRGAGVYVDTGTFTMESGVVSGNRSGGGMGGGVYVTGTGTFTMNGGKISGNWCGSIGGGVCISSTGTPAFDMNGGTISGNWATQSGGGVYISSGTFHISRNHKRDVRPARCRCRPYQR